jgi:hypothetical protein
MSITARELYAAAALQALSLQHGGGTTPNTYNADAVQTAWDVSDAMDKEGTRRLAIRLHYPEAEEVNV